MKHIRFPKIIYRSLTSSNEAHEKRKTRTPEAQKVSSQTDNHVLEISVFLCFETI